MIDVDFAFQTTTAEGWGYSRDDFTSILNDGIGSHFIAEENEGKRRIGMVSTYDYGGKLGWIGNVVVLKEYRQRGVAAALVKRAMDHLKTKRITTVRLYSYLDAEPLYKKLRFIKERVVGVFSATPSENRSLAHQITASDRGGLTAVNETNLQKLYQLDEKCFGADRRNILAPMIQDKNAICFVQAQETDREKILGYVVACKSESECDIGPMVCDPEQEEVARKLIESVMNHFNAEKYTLATAVDNLSHSRILRSLGFMKTMEVLKMRKGRNLYNGKPAWIFGVAGLEKG
jgi:ribosomal protein S18 acetylase RimI-like enzyme